MKRRSAFEDPLAAPTRDMEEERRQIALYAEAMAGTKDDLELALASAATAQLLEPRER